MNFSSSEVLVTNSNRGGCPNGSEPTLDGDASLPIHRHRRRLELSDAQYTTGTLSYSIASVLTTNIVMKLTPNSKVTKGNRRAVRTQPLPRIEPP